MNIKKNDIGYVIFYSLLMLITLITSNFVVLSSIDILGSAVVGSAFTFVFVFYFANKLITKIDKRLLLDILIGIVFVQLIVFYLMNGCILLSNVSSVLAFIIANLLNMSLFNGIEKKKISFVYVLSVYCIVIIVDAILFNLFMYAGIDSALLYSIVIKLCFGLGLSLLTYKDISK